MNLVKSHNMCYIYTNETNPSLAPNSCHHKVRNPRPRPSLRTRLYNIAERRQRPNSVKRVFFILFEALQTNMSWLTMRSTLSLMKGGGSSKRWSKSRTRTKAILRIKMGCSKRSMLWHRWYRMFRHGVSVNLGFGRR